MQKIYIVLSMLSAWTSMVTAADAENLSVPHVTVVGTSTKDIAPDRLNWSVEVKTTGIDLPKVAEQHAKEVAAVLAVLKVQNLPEKDVRTADMQFSENQVRRNDAWVKEGYYASTVVVFHLTDLTKYKQLWLSLAAVSNVSVRKVDFDHSNRTALQKETRVKALLEAKEKASLIAETLGAKVGEPLAIVDEPEEYSRMGFPGALDPFVDINNATPLAPGTIPIQSRVQVSFRLTSAGN